jgi:hypothetical protein
MKSKMRRLISEACPKGGHVYYERCSFCDYRGIIYHSQRPGKTLKVTVQCKYEVINDQKNNETNQALVLVKKD